MNTQNCFVIAQTKDDKWLFYCNGSWVEDKKKAEIFEKTEAINLCEEFAKEEMDVVVFNKRILELM